MEEPNRGIDFHSASTTGRHIGIVGATGVGVGAIVGGGILALAGVAFSTAGPAAMVAFALNGLIALLTALSFAEMSTKFPESGGTYTFAKKVLSVEAAFTVGWVVWFASIVAAVLYAVGFAHFGLAMMAGIWGSFIGHPPEWLAGPYANTFVATLATILLAIGLTILVPVGGRGGHDRIRARLLGSMTRAGDSKITFFRVLPENATSQEIIRAKRELSRFAEDEVHQSSVVEVVASDDPVAVVAERSIECDLVVLGVQRLDRRNKLYGSFVREVALRTSSPIVFISRRG